MEIKRRRLGIFLVIGAILVILFTLGRALYFSPATDDSGLSATSTPNLAAMIAAGNVVSNGTSLSEKPARLIIPRLGIDADIQHLGITAKGNMAAPNNFTDVGWYKYGPLPGKAGSAVIAGHEDNAISLDGVFKHLEDLTLGDEIIVVMQDGRRSVFEVYDERIHPYNLTGPALEEIFNKTGGVYLNLITCAGDWLPSAKTNDQRLVIYAERVS